jgi:hypothetical protein
VLMSGMAPSGLPGTPGINDTNMVQRIGEKEGGREEEGERDGMGKEIGWGGGERKR